MIQIIECVPNFSTSNPETVDAILREINSVKGAHILDVTYDDYYNRLVVSFVGEKTSVLKAATKSAARAIELIDMTKHKGQHPRLGAVDVVPFIPIKNATIEECVELAKEFGAAFAAQAKVPVYLYGRASDDPRKADLDWIREGEYEKSPQMIIRSDRRPDFGPQTFVPKSGATITGARKIMAGFNVNIGTSNLKIAKKIAKALHAAKGGFTNVKAMAASIPGQNITQIGMSINDFEKTPLYRIFEVLKIECARYDIPIVGSEFCGMAPLKSLIDTASYYLRIDNLNEERVLEIAANEAMENGGSPE